MDFDAWLAHPLLGQPAGRWLAAVGVAAAVFAALVVVKWLVLGRVRAMAARTSTSFDDAVVAALLDTRRVFLAVVSLWAASQILALPAHAHAVARSALALATLLQGGIWGHSLLRHYLEHVAARRAAAEPEVATTLGVVGFVGRVVLWSVVALLMLANLGVDVTALVAGLGVGGIAVALAVQRVLGDLLASFSILFDKPFVVGDSITVGDLQGTVLHVGLRSTRLRSVTGEEVIVSNSDLLASRIRNFRRLDERRVLFRLGFEYGTSPQALAALPGLVADAVATQADARYDRCHFVAFGDSSLQVEVVYFVTSPELARYMDVQHAVNLALYSTLIDRGLRLAFPTRTVHMPAQSPRKDP